MRNLILIIFFLLSNIIVISAQKRCTVLEDSLDLQRWMENNFSFRDYDTVSCSKMSFYNFMIIDIQLAPRKGLEIVLPPKKENVFYDQISRLLENSDTLFNKCFLEKLKKKIIIRQPIIIKKSYCRFDDAAAPDNLDDTLFDLKLYKYAAKKVSEDLETLKNEIQIFGNSNLQESITMPTIYLVDKRFSNTPKK